MEHLCGSCIYQYFCPTLRCSDNMFSFSIVCFYLNQSVISKCSKCNSLVSVTRCYCWGDGGWLELAVLPHGFLLSGSSPAWQWVPLAPFDDFCGSWRASQEGAWCLVRSDTDNWNRQDRGTRKLFSFQFYSAEVREAFHSMFTSA